MPRPPTADLKQRLLGAARRLLVSEGYEGFSLRQVAKAAEVSPTAVYLHFENKDALLHALLDEGMGLLHAQLVASGEGLSDPHERLDVLCRAYIAFGLANGELYDVMFNLAPSRMARYPVEMYRRAYRNQQMFHAVLAACWGRDDADAPDLRLAVTTMWSTLHGAVCLITNQRIDFGLEAQQLIDQAVELAVTLGRRAG